MKVFGIVGWKDTGKTTLVAGLVREFTRRGVTVSTVKHAHKGYEIDRDGTDSATHRAAGAAQVALVAEGRWALLTEKEETQDDPLGAMLERLAPCDLVLVEGFKRYNHPMIECVGDEPPLYSSNDTVVALAAPSVHEAALPVFARDDVAGIADFITRFLGLK